MHPTSPISASPIRYWAIAGSFAAFPAQAHAHGDAVVVVFSWIVAFAALFIGVWFVPGWLQRIAVVASTVGATVLAWALLKDVELVGSRGTLVLGIMAFAPIAGLGIGLYIARRSIWRRYFRRSQ